MRTKALLLAAAVTVVTCATASAAVYSANAVGYVNITLEKGFSILGNPLKGTNNLLNTILPLGAGGVGVGLYKFDAATGNYSGKQTYFGGTTQWFPGGGTVEIKPGEGFFIDVPESRAPLNITFVGEVMQGEPLTGPATIIGGKYNLLASEVPQDLPLGTTGTAGTLEFPAAVGDKVYFFLNAAQTFSGATTFFGGATGWFPPPSVGPTVPVATGFFVLKAAGDVDWSRNFTVN